MAAEHDIDRIVDEAFFKGRPTGLMVDVGAAGPEYLSISALFRDRGWRIFAIEPNPAFCELHRQRGHEILQYACSDQERDGAEFFIVDSKGSDYMGGAVTFESFSSLGIAGKYGQLHETVEERTNTRSIFVNVRKLDTLLATYAPDVSHIDLLAIDVEGWELAVMRGLSISKFKPSVVILENLFSDPTYYEFMDNAGYLRWRTVFPNEIYLRKDAEMAP